MTDYYQILRYYVLVAIGGLPLLISWIAGVRNYFRHSDLRDFLRRPSAVMPWKTRSSKWGIVYDAATKMPIPGAVVKIYSEPDGRLKEAQTTPQIGTFGLLVPAGRYSIKVLRSGYTFPSSSVTGATDGYFQHVYHGGPIEVSDKGGGKGLINVNIPLDPMHGTVAVAFPQVIRRIFVFLRLLFLAAGTAMAGYLFVAYFSHWPSHLLVGLYALTWIFTGFGLTRPRGFGLVSGPNRRGIGMVTVRALDEFGRIRATVVTSDDGKFMMTLEPGNYLFNASRIGYESVQTKIHSITKPEDLSKVNIRLQKFALVRPEAKFR